MAAVLILTSSPREFTAAGCLHFNTVDCRRRSPSTSRRQPRIAAAFSRFTVDIIRLLGLMPGRHWATEGPPFTPYAGAMFVFLPPVRPRLPSLIADTP